MSEMFANWPCYNFSFSGALAYSSGLSASFSTSESSGSTMSFPVLESVMCSGSELRLINCSAMVPQDSCQTVGYAGVVCQGCIYKANVCQ